MVLDKETVINAIRWSEGMTKDEAEYLYSVTSERYHKRIAELYEEAKARYWIVRDIYHPIYNPISARERNRNKIQLTIIFMELLLAY